MLLKAKTNVSNIVTLLLGNKEVTAVLESGEHFTSPYSSECDTAFFPSCDEEFFKMFRKLDQEDFHNTGHYDISGNMLYDALGRGGKVLMYSLCDTHSKPCSAEDCAKEISNFFQDHSAIIQEDGHLLVSYNDCTTQL